jgi:hypothetical protein
MLKHIASLLLLLALLAASCVEHYEFKYLTDSAVPGGTDALGADGNAEIGIPDLVVDPDALPDSLGDAQGDALPDLVIDLSDVPIVDIKDSIYLDQTDAIDPEIIDLVDEEIPCIPQCTDLECGDDSCGGDCGICDDGIDCTTDKCTGGTCDFVPLTGDECSDVNPCTGSEGICDEGFCKGALLPLEAIEDFEECFCAKDEDCSQFDTNPCDTTKMVCDLEIDSDAQPHCHDETVEELDCNDGIDCTDDGCDSGTGCVHMPNDTKCNQSNPCLSATCSKAEGCLYTPTVDIECDDKNLCTVGDTCGAGTCQAGSEELECDDKVDCTVDSCDPITGCAYAEDNTICDDSNLCTDDSCDPEKDCQNDNNVSPCDDGFLCTVDDICTDGLCAGMPKVCDDKNVCTLDSCNPDDGECQTDPVPNLPSVPCNDSDNLCTEEDGECVAGECVGPTIPCDDGNPCTNDSCDPSAGCIYVNNEASCSDGNSCTIGDYCLQGGCLPGPGIDIDCLDYDHDGLANGVDSCPLAFDGKELDMNLDGAKDACAPVKNAPPMTRALNLQANGLSSMARRTHEVVEIPLVNGLADQSARGYLPLDGDASMPYEKEGSGGLLIGTEPAEGVFGDPSGALYFGGEDAIFFGGIELPDVTTICLWMDPDEVHDFAFGATFPSGIAAKFDFKGEEGEITVLLRSSPTDSFLLSTTKSVTEQFFDGDWHQICYRWDVLVGTGDIFLDGRLWPSSVSTLGAPVMSATPLPQWYIGAAYDGQLGIPVSHYKGRLDEMLVANRNMTVGELEAYYYSNSPFATPLLPGAQPDFDDVRIVDEGYEGTPVYRRNRIVGVRQHSDSPCPSGTSPATYPHREDLCGVVAYWQLGSELDSVIGNYHLTSDSDTELQLGRFSDEEGASVFHDGSEVKSSTISAAPQLKDDDLAVELWYFIRPNHLSGGYLMGLPVSPTENVLELHVAENGDIEWTISTSGNTVTLTASGGVERWVHVALNYDGAKAVLFVDGYAQDGTPLTGTLKNSSLPMYIGSSGPLEELKARVMMDDVLIHDTAKTADYFFSRTHPALPSVRFFAGTKVDNAGTEDNPSYPARDYVVGWGDEDAIMVTPYTSSKDVGFACHGLLNSCLGYVGWWTFDGFEGDFTPDLSNRHLHASLVGSSSVAAGSDGLSVLLGGSSFFEVGYVSDMQSEKFTLESLSKGGSGTLIARGNGSPEEVFNYSLSVESGGEILAQFEADDETHISAKSEPLYNDGSYHSIAATYGGAQLLSFLDGQTVGGTETAVVPGATARDLLLGATNIMGAHAGFFSGHLDEVRLMNRALTVDEMSHFPRIQANPGGFLDSGGFPLDSDKDGILDDGDGSLKIGDNPCVGGNTVDCDDNAVDTPNGGQADEDGDGVGTVVDNCPDDMNASQADHDSNGIGDACDPTFLQDWDHDGLVGDDDPCPFAFDGAHLDYDGDDHPDACKPYSDGYENGNSFWMEEGGEQGRRTTNEVVELALQSGILDASTLLYLPFEENTIKDGSPNTMAGFSLSNGPENYLGGPSGFGSAVTLGSETCLSFPDPFTYPLGAFTVMTWVQAEESVTIFDNGEIDDIGNPPSAIGFTLHYSAEGKLILIFGEGNYVAYGEAGFQPWNGADWHHVAVTFKGGLARIFVDGQPQTSINFSGDFTALEGDGMNPLVGCDTDGANPGAVNLDEFLLFNRPLSLREIRNYIDSNKPYGSSLVPGSQTDFDDIRIKEYPYDDETGDSYVTRARLIGVREHSDSQCPPDVPEGTLATRDDLCGVEGFWKLDWALGEEVVQGDNSPLKAEVDDQAPWLTFGRYGSPNGGTRFSNRSQSLTVPSVPELNPGTGSFTTETWIRVPDPSVGSVLYPVDKVDGNSNGYQIAYVMSSGFSACQWFGNAGEMIVLGANDNSLNDGQWHHLGCVLDRTPGQPMVGILYVDGLEAKRYEAPENHLSTLSSDTVFRIGWGNNAGELSQELDDVLYHSVAKSADYFFNRARPSVPSVRFLVNSTTIPQGPAQSPQYPLRGYEIVWGKEGAESQQAVVAKPGSDEVCFGLVNECLGYVGWWRIDDLDSSVVLDSGPYHHSGDAVGSMHWRFNNDQFGLANNASPGSITVLSAPHLAQERGTWEAVFSPGFDIDGSSPKNMSIIHRSNESGNDDYAATLGNDGPLIYNRWSHDGGFVNLQSQKNSWFKDQIYHAAFEAGNGSNTFAVDYKVEPESSAAEGGFGADGANLYFGAYKANSYYFSGTFYEFRLISRVLESDEYMRQTPLRAYLN